VRGRGNRVRPVDHDAATRTDIRRAFWTTFLLVFAVEIVWAVAMPLFSAADEPSHVIRAAAVARGQLLGDEPRPPLTADDVKIGQGGLEGGRPTAYLAVSVAGIYASPNWGCFDRHREVAANCLTFGGSTAARTVLTPVARYPPLYYALVGIPARLVRAGSHAVYLMRAVSAALTAALVASAVLSLRRLRRPVIALVGLLLALTPTVLYFGAMVNPSGLEIVAALALWASGGVLATEASTGIVDARVVHRVGIAACLLVLSRQLAPVWLAAVLVTLGLLATRPGLAALARSSVVRAWSVVAGVCSVAAIAWIAWAGPLASGASIFPGDPRPMPQILRDVIGASPHLVPEMIARLGWLDTPAPAATMLLWLVLVGALVALGLALGGRAGALAAALVVAAAVIPVLLEFLGARSIGLTYQGRYTLPLAVGIPVLAAIGIARSESRGALRFSRESVIACGAGVVLAQSLAFAQTLRRYSVGYDGPLLFWQHARWSPPIWPLLALAGFIVVTTALTSWLLLGADTRRDRGSTPDAGRQLVGSAAPRT
jgi:hypothetical protein